MIKQETYGKTERIRPGTFHWLITEKLDGANLCIGMTQNGRLLIHQRARILTLDEADQLEYKGLSAWVKKHAGVLQTIYPGSVLCGEWLGMGRLKYPESEFPNPFNVFAKARYLGPDGPEIDTDTLDYDPKTFGYVTGGELPGCISAVPVVGHSNVPPTITQLDMLYSARTELTGRPVEGFVITDIGPGEHRCKYVRMKNGKVAEHYWG